jgi:hypothetical protein
MPVYRFVLAMVLALYVGFSRLNHLRFLEREPMLIGILKVPRLPPNGRAQELQPEEQGQEELPAYVQRRLVYSVGVNPTRTKVRVL